MTYHRSRQSAKRKAEAAAKTRTETALNDGRYKKKRQDAEAHIARIICRHASDDDVNIVGGGQKSRDIFDYFAHNRYSGLSLKFNRVRDCVYKILRSNRTNNEEDRKERDVATDKVEDDNESQDEVSFFLL